MKWIINLEQTALEIQEERERTPRYFLTLWWGFDGLQEREDGTWAWISRRKKETPIPAFVPCSSVWNTTPVINYWSCCQSSEADRLRVSCAQTQNAAQCFLAGQGGAGGPIAQLQAELANVNRTIAMNEYQRRISEMISKF